MKVIEYEDMTDAQKAIVDAGMRPSVGVVPMHLNDEELLKWMMDRVKEVPKTNTK